MHVPWVAVLVVLLGGCADGLVEQQARDAQLVGRQQAELLKTLGPPTRTAVDGDTTRLTYELRRQQTVPGAPFCNGPGSLCGGSGFPAPPLAPLVCDTIFTVNGGIVRSYDLRGFCG